MVWFTVFFTYRECHSHGLNSHSCDCVSWPCILRKGWSHYAFFCILLSDVNVCIVNGQRLKLNTVNGQSPENQHGQQSNAEKSWSKSWPSCGHTCGYGVYGSDTPLMYIREYPAIPIQYSRVIKCSSLIIESVDSICRGSADTQYMLIQTNFSKSPKQLTYKPL